MCLSEQERVGNGSKDIMLAAGYFGAGQAVPSLSSEAGGARSVDDLVHNWKHMIMFHHAADLFHLSNGRIPVVPPKLRTT